MIQLEVNEGQIVERSPVIEFIPVKASYEAIVEARRAEESDVESIDTRNTERPGRNSGRSVNTDLVTRYGKRPGGNSGRSVADVVARDGKRPGGNSG